MIRPRREWIVSRRKADVKRPCYQAGFLRPDGKYRLVTLHDDNGHNVTNKKIAEDLARKQWEEGVPGTSEGFGPFLESFWAKGGVYSRDKRDQGDPLTVVYQSNNYNNVRRHIRPALKKLGKDELPIDRVTPELLKSIMRTVGDKGVKGRTVNTVRQTFAVPIRLYWEGKLHPEKNPCTARLVPHFDEEPGERFIFTLEEARAFLAHDFGDPRLTLIERQAAFTGMRLGECLGMQHGDIAPQSVQTEDAKGRPVTITEYWVDVRHNWQEREPEGKRVKGPKKKSFGNVPVPPVVAQELLKLEKANPYRGPFLYWGHTEKRPIPKDEVERSFNAACRAIGITDAERKRRGLGFHAWRHWYDTHIAGRVSAGVLQKLMRHRTAEMTAHYNHLTEEQRRGAAAAAVGLLGMVSDRDTPAGKRKPRRRSKPPEVIP